MTDEIDRVLEQVGREVGPGRPSAYFAAHRLAYRDDLRRLAALHLGGRLLEVGGFPYFFSACLARLGWRPRILDLRPERFEDRWRELGVDVERCDIEQDRWPDDEASLETIVMAAVFEHLRIDPLHALREARRVLAPEGRLYLTTPNFYRLGNVARLLTGKGPANDPVREYAKLRTDGHMGHVREYAAAELRLCLRATGFTRIDLTYRTLGASHRGRWVDWAHLALRPTRPELVVVAQA